MANDGKIDFNQIDQVRFYQAIQDGVRQGVFDYLLTDDDTLKAGVREGIENAALDGLIKLDTTNG